MKTNNRALKEIELNQITPDEYRHQMKDKRRCIAVGVNILLPEEVANTFNNDELATLHLTRLTKRGTTMYIRGFCVKNSTFTFFVQTELPACFSDVYESENLNAAKPLATTFQDFCWLQAEGTTNKTALEIPTSAPTNTQLGDLTWVVPSKFADDLIECMHALNLTILEGTMYDAMMYGPIFF
jgi:uncharacterized FAD-dependent dehydrogenase